jgi:TRAP-type mannitol/chloroaromatic compound transport system substrate-binding protein
MDGGYTMRIKYLLAASLAALVIAQPAAAEKTRWKMHTTYVESLPVLGSSAPALSDAVGVMSDGDFKIKVYNPGELLKEIKYFDAVSNGSIDAAIGTSAYHAGRNPAYMFFSAVPFGPRAGEYMAWFKYGGGLKLAQELYARDNMHFEVCGIIPPETSGWFRKEIKSTEDLKGLKMRFFGLGAKVMEKFGVSTQLLAGGDIFPALELGTIDAAEYSMPALDRARGFHQVAKYNYFPGWHQPATTIELVVNMDKWKKLSKARRRMVQEACGSITAANLAEGEALQFDAMIANEKDGVKNIRWSDEILDQFQAAWLEVVTEEVKGSEDAKRIWESYSAFREKYKVWGEMGYVK